MSQAPNPYQQSNALSRQAYAHWEAGRLAEAAEGFSAAITLVRDGGLPAVADLHAQLAGVRDAQGQLAEAVAQSELALAAEQVLGGASDAGPAVKIARHFLADRLVRHGHPQRALDVLAPSLAALPDDWLLNMTQAEALSSMRRTDEARVAAERAVAHAGSEAKRAQIAERLAAALRS